MISKFGVREVQATRDTIARAAQEPLSDKVRAVIEESQIPSLQKLLRADGKTQLLAMCVDYWKVED